MTRLHHWLPCLFVLVLAAPAVAQVPPPAVLDVTIDVDSGVVSAPADRRSVVWSQVVHVTDVSWLRLHFDHASLGAAPIGGEPTVLRITSLVDGARQHHWRRTLREWGYTSAYFNGHAVLVEIIADPGAGTSRVRATRATAGPITPPGTLTICDAVDDRIPSDDPRVARVQPVSCTVWLIGDTSYCLLGAGHCSFPDSNYQVVEFNVPLSDAGGNAQHPGPDDQYAVDGTSLQHQSQGQGDDWSYFGCFANTETGLTAFEAQGDAFVLADAPPAPSGEIRITGYGTTSPPVPEEWNRAQKTHAGPYVQAVPGDVVRYRTDTTGGNSGSPVIHEDTGLAIGIHTHGGCGNGTGQNTGTAIDHVLLQAALASPDGVCEPGPMTLTFPDGRPEILDPDGDSVRVEFSGGAGPVPDTGFLHYRPEGEMFTHVPMVQVMENVYDAVFPAIDCGQGVDWSVSAVNVTGSREFFPPGALDILFRSVSGTGLDFVFSDDFETDTGWTVSGDAAGGTWERGVPAGNGAFGDPVTDADESGQCYTTGLAQGDDVDGGSTTLTSPLLDATDGDAHLAFWCWFANSFGDNPGSDTMNGEISNDNGASWIQFAFYDPSSADGGWQHETYRVADFVIPTATMRVRFTVQDLGGDSAVEAGIDGFRVNRSASGVTCGTCTGDLDGNGVVDVDDLLGVLGGYGTPAGDVDGDGDTDVDDLLAVLGAWGPC